jgi:hypothetical protein
MLYYRIGRDYLMRLSKMRQLCKRCLHKLPVHQLADYLRHEIAGLSQAIKWSSSLLDKYPGSIVRLVWDDFANRPPGTGPHARAPAGVGPAGCQLQHLGFTTNYSGRLL